MKQENHQMNWWKKETENFGYFSNLIKAVIWFCYFGSNISRILIWERERERESKKGLFWHNGSKFFLNI